MDILLSLLIILCSMIYSLDFTEEGKICEIVIKGIPVSCVVVCAFEKTNKERVVQRRYRLMGKNNTIYENILSSEIIFKK